MGGERIAPTHTLRLSPLSYPAVPELRAPSEVLGLADEEQLRARTLSAVCGSSHTNRDIVIMNSFSISFTSSLSSASMKCAPSGL